MRIGILALQGDFEAHARMVSATGGEAILVRELSALRELDGLVLPGGESTAIGILGAGLLSEIGAFVQGGKPVLATCAGAIMLACEVVGRAKITGILQPLIGVLDIAVQRNGFGSQRYSFETDLDVPVLGQPLFPAVFIRAPRIMRVGKGVEVVAALPSGEPVAVRSGNVLAMTFHPELTKDLRFHYLGLRCQGGVRRRMRAEVWD